METLRMTKLEGSKKVNFSSLERQCTYTDFDKVAIALGTVLCMQMREVSEANQADGYCHLIMHLSAIHLLRFYDPLSGC